MYISNPNLENRPVELERLILAGNFLDNVDKENLSLTAWVTHVPSAIFKPTPEEPCGTIACGMGWLTFDPNFQALGLRLIGIRPTIFKDTEELSTLDTIKHLFGGRYDTVFMDVFSNRGDSRFDKNLGVKFTGYDDYDNPILGGDDVSDKTLLMYRIDQLTAELSGEIPVTQPTDNEEN